MLEQYFSSTGTLFTKRAKKDNTKANDRVFSVAHNVEMYTSSEDKAAKLVKNKDVAIQRSDLDDMNHSSPKDKEVKRHREKYLEKIKRYGDCDVSILESVIAHKESWLEYAEKSTGQDKILLENRFQELSKDQSLGNIEYFLKKLASLTNMYVSINEKEKIAIVSPVFTNNSNKNPYRMKEEDEYDEKAMREFKDDNFPLNQLKKYK